LGDQYKDGLLSSDSNSDTYCNPDPNAVTIAHSNTNTSTLRKSNGLPKRQSDHHQQFATFAGNCVTISGCDQHFGLTGCYY